MEHLSPCSTTTEAHAPKSLCSATKAAAMRRHHAANWEQALLTTTRQRPRAAMKWPSTASINFFFLVKHAEVVAIFSKIKIYVWKHTELYSHRLKYVYFISDIKTKASTSRTLQNFQSPVTNPISFDPTQSEKETGDTLFPFYRWKNRF